MLKQLRFITILFLVVTACTKTSHLLPEEIEINKISTYKWGTDHVTEFQINNDEFNLSKLNDYPLDHPGTIIIRTPEKVLVKWIRFKDLALKEQDYIISSLEETIELNRLEGDEKANDLMNLIKSSENVFFSGHGHKMIGAKHTKYNFYEYMYFLDMKTMKIIEIANHESHL